MPSNTRLRWPDSGHCSVLGIFSFKVNISTMLPVIRSVVARIINANLAHQLAVMISMCLSLISTPLFL